MQAKTLSPTWLDRTLFPFESRTMKVAGNTIHYIDEGSGPTLLLLHGNTTWSFLYRHIVNKLRPHFRCIALDYPGFGLSTPAANYRFLPSEHSAIVEGFVDALSLQNLRIMVQDWGGPIGLGFAGRRPELVHSLLIGNTWAWPANQSKGMATFSRILGSRIARFFITRRNALAAWLIPAGINRKLEAAELAAYMGPFDTPQSRLPTWIFPREILRSHSYLAQVESNLSSLRNKPVLLLWGEADGAFGSAERLRFERIFPHAKVILLKNAKHFIQENAPDEISAAIQSFAQA